MPGHGDAQLHAGGADIREDAVQRGGRGGRLGLAAVEAVGELVQRLAHRVAEGHAAAVQEGERAHAPAQQHPGHCTAQCACMHQNFILSLIPSPMSSSSTSNPTP